MTNTALGVIEKHDQLASQKTNAIIFKDAELSMILKGKKDYGCKRNIYVPISGWYR